MKFIGFIFLFVTFSLPGICQGLSDKNATWETKALYENLKKYSARGFIFGHQDDDAYGVGWKAGDGGSDVKAVCGAYPGVHGWDLGKLGQPRNLDSVSFEDMHRWIKQVYERGGINTISWHVENPVSKKSAWDKTPAVRDILPGGAENAFFTKQLDLVAEFLDACQADDGTKIPIIFRPWHEHNGDWFWWGKGNCTEEEYIALWKWTVSYLRDEKKLHHLIYAISPDRSRMNLETPRQSYLYGYPGDDIIDILGFDNYMDVGASWNKKPEDERMLDFVNSLTTVSRLAYEKKKVAAITETGLEGVTKTDWYTFTILKSLKDNPQINVAWVLVWRNFNTNHHYVPYPGHAAEEDFRKFHHDSRTFFESDLKDIYK